MGEVSNLLNGKNQFGSNSRSPSVMEKSLLVKSRKPLTAIVGTTEGEKAFQDSQANGDHSERGKKQTEGGREKIDRMDWVWE